MLVHHFNRGPRRKPGRKPTALIRAREETQDEDIMGLLDPGFEDIGIKVHDYQVAPGVMGHFNTLDNPPAGYHALPTFERL